MTKNELLEAAAAYGDNMRAAVKEYSDNIKSLETVESDDWQRHIAITFNDLPLPYEVADLVNAADCWEYVTSYDCDVYDRRLRIFLA